MIYCQLHQRINASHANSCPACIETNRQLSLAESLLQSRASVINQQSQAQPSDFMMKLTARLRAESEPVISSWEAAILSLRGWAITCSAAVLLLIAIATTAILNRPPSDDEILIFTANANESISHDSFWAGE